MAHIQMAFHHERPIDPNALRTLYTIIGWWPQRTEKEIAQVLQNALAIGAWENEQLVGFARVVSDQYFRAFIEDVVIHLTFQRTGLGTRLLTLLLDALPHIETITIFCHSDLVPFYEEQGFRAFPSQMVIHRQQTRSPENTTI